MINVHVRSAIFGVQRAVAEILDVGRFDFGLWTLDLGRRLEPAFFVLNVGSNEIFVRLGEVDDAFDDSNDRAGATGHKSDDDLNNSFSGVAKDELVYAKATEHDSANTGD
jgi:hypothetical protein